VSGLSRYTGLDPRYVDLADLRPNIHRFCKELHRDERRTVGRLDSRFEGFDQNAVGEMPGFDPSYLAILPPYTTLLNQYVREELGFKTDIPYEALSMEVNQGWEHPKNQYTNTAVHLRDAFNKNPPMNLYVGMGYYDLATPYFAALYTLNHMELDPAHREHITTAYYEAGHMFYIETKSLVQMTEDIEAFVHQ
jgi:carboxypeptidase C (cathepsin A)